MGAKLELVFVDMGDTSQGKGMETAWTSNLLLSFSVGDAMQVVV